MSNAMPKGSGTNPNKKEYKCHLCFQTYGNSRALKQHLRIHSEAKPFVCKVCGQSFPWLSNLRCHERIHQKPGSNHNKPENSDLLHCQYCNKAFETSKNLNRHLKYHLPDKPYHCKSCTKTFDDQASCLKHEKRHEVKLGFQCEFCDRCFKDSYYFRVHQRVHTGERPFVCKFCEKTFSQSSSCVRHEKLHQAAITTEDGSGNNDNVEIIMGALPSRSPKTKTLKKPQIKNFVCIGCDKAFYLASSLRRHLKNHHTAETRTLPDLKCDYCDKIFHHTGDLKKHTRVHTGERPYECTECGQSFAISATLKKHQKTHLNQRRKKGVSVDLIDENTDGIADDNASDKSYSCKICGKVFAYPSTLRCHERTHNNHSKTDLEANGGNVDSPPHVKYKDSKDYQTVMANGVLSYVCLSCFAQFTQESDLHQHSCDVDMQVNDSKGKVKTGHIDSDDEDETKKLKHVCKFCNKRFRKMEAMKVHYRVHTGEKPYRCDLCETNFTQVSGFRRHMYSRNHKAKMNLRVTLLNQNDDGGSGLITPEVILNEGQDDECGLDIIAPEVILKEGQNDEYPLDLTAEVGLNEEQS